jgi:hypothetical protein
MAQFQFPGFDFQPASRFHRCAVLGWKDSIEM